MIKIPMLTQGPRFDHFFKLFFSAYEMDEKIFPWAKFSS
jgi:hypothetical protein